MTNTHKQNPWKGKRNIVIIGASAGGVQALLELVATLPHDFPAAIFVVQHLAPYSQSFLPELLARVSPLKAKHPHDGEQLKMGTIYVAPPDHHLLLEDDTILIKRGPKENRFRPSIDALFRSAAYVHGPRVIGVVLTGYLDDGTSGLWSVQRMGGVVVVQDPQDASFPDMPTNVLEFVEPDYVTPLAELSALLVRLTAEPAASKHAPLSQLELDRLKIELSIAQKGNAFELGIINQGKLTAFTCPDCHGALTKLIEGNIIRFRCHTGHAYTINALLSEVSESVESMLYQSMRGLEETKMLLQDIGAHFAETKQQGIADLFFQKADSAGKQARVLHNSIVKHEVLSGDLRRKSKSNKHE